MREPESAQMTAALLESFAPKLLILIVFIAVVSILIRYFHANGA
jgi:hypothetical protein